MTSRLCALRPRASRSPSRPSPQAFTGASSPHVLVFVTGFGLGFGRQPTTNFRRAIPSGTGTGATERSRREARGETRRTRTTARCDPRTRRGGRRRREAPWARSSRIQRGDGGRVVGSRRRRIVRSGSASSWESFRTALQNPDIARGVVAGERAGGRAGYRCHLCVTSRRSSISSIPESRPRRRRLRRLNFFPNPRAEPRRRRRLPRRCPRRGRTSRRRRPCPRPCSSAPM